MWSTRTLPSRRRTSIPVARAKTPAPARLRLNIVSDPANLADVRRAVEDYARAHGFDEDACGEVGLCVNEALANVIRHAYRGAPDRPIEIGAARRAGDGALVVRIRDWGSGVRPPTCPPQQKDPMTPGGLGLICLHKMMDEVRFSPQPDGMLLEMCRRRGRKKR